MRIKVFDFSPAVAGPVAGSRRPELTLVFALDCDPEAEQTYTGNFPKAHFEFADIRTVGVEQVQRHVNATGASPVLFSGCAVCQPFTKQNTTHPDVDHDDRVPSLLRFADLVEACRHARPTAEVI